MFSESAKNMGENISQNEVNFFFLLKSTVFRASRWNLLFYDGLLTVFLFLEDRGRLSDLDICTVTQYLSIFAKYFIGFRKSEIWLKNISQSEIQSFLSKYTVFRASHCNLLFHDGLLTVLFLLEDRWRPSDLNLFTVNPSLSIFENYLTSYRKREKDGWEVSREVKLKVFLLKSTVFRASHWNLLFYDGLLKGLPLVRRPWKTVTLGYLYSNSIS